MDEARALGHPQRAPWQLHNSKRCCAHTWGMKGGYGPQNQMWGHGGRSRNLPLECGSEFTATWTPQAAPLPDSGGGAAWSWSGPLGLVWGV